MLRSYWLGKLKGIIERVESGASPAQIKQIYAFGSFARGATEPNDLDLIVIHERPSLELMKSLKQQVASYSRDDLTLWLNAHARFESAMRKVFRRGSEKIDVLLGNDIEAVLKDRVKFPRNELTLIWSERNRDWESKIAAITVDASARAYPRNHFMDIKKTLCEPKIMEFMTSLIDNDVLILKKINLDSSEPPLSDLYQDCLRHWVQTGSVGAKAIQTLPWALWWLESEGVSKPWRWKSTEFGDFERQFYLQLGRIYPAFLYSQFKTLAVMQKQALLPLRRSRGENWLYVFERGPNWLALKHELPSY